MIRKALPLLIFILGALCQAGAQVLELSQVMKDLEATFQWNPYTEVGYLNVAGGQGSRIIFKLGSPWVLIDYQFLVSTPGIVRREGQILFPEETVEALKAFLRGKIEKRGLGPRVAVILIDPGHGGKDAGAIGSFSVDGKSVTIMEKDVVLKVGLLLHRLLKERYPDKQILLTRQEDSYLRLEDRTELANGISLGEHEAIIFLSIHANASFNRQAKGFEVWYLPPDYRRELIDPEALEGESREIAPILNVLLEEEYTLESITLAKEVLDQFAQQVGGQTENRGLKAESWFVVRNARMPSILIELGFVTHQEEALKLSQEDYLQKLVQALYTGVCNFVQFFEHTRGFTE